MITKIKSFIIVFLITGIGFIACKKTEYTFGEIKTPSGLVLNAVVAGVDATNPNGNGSGNVTITVDASNAINYKIDFGDGKTKIVSAGTFTYKYSTPGTNEYTIIVNAAGTGGTISTISKKVKIFVAFEIPAAIVQSLTGGTSKVWVTDAGADGHFGVGPSDMWTPFWYAATPNSREACAYDDEITFTKNGLSILMSVDNKGQSFSIGASSSFYGFGGGDACLDINAGGSKKLVFFESTNTPSNVTSTNIKFDVPGNGIINFGTGGTTYEILSITDTKLFLRNIGIDGNSWYQKLKVK